jgi:hypothetical protein
MAPPDALDTSLGRSTAASAAPTTPWEVALFSAKEVSEILKLVLDMVLTCGKGIPRD